MKLPLSLRASVHVVLAFSALLVFFPSLAFATAAHASDGLPALRAVDRLAESAGRAILAAATGPAADPDPVALCDRGSTRGGGVPACRAAAYEFFRDKGLTRDQAAAIVGNLWLESSGVSPKTRQFGGGPGRGIAQWTVWDRWQGVLGFARARGVDAESMQVQLDFLWHEMTTTYKHALAAIKSAPSLLDATLAFQNKFEVPIGTRIGGGPYEINAHPRAHTVDRVRFALAVANRASAGGWKL